MDRWFDGVAEKIHLPTTFYSSGELQGKYIFKEVREDDTYPVI
jgi:hypothetical protein